jgi:hypothetical protein
VTTNESETKWSRVKLLLERRGWARYPAPTKPQLCLGEAIAVVLSDNGDRRALYPQYRPDQHANPTQPVPAALKEFADHVNQKAGFLGYSTDQPGERVMAWNDRAYRTLKDVTDALDELHNKTLIAQMRERSLARLCPMPNTRMPEHILPYTTDANGETTECQICGEPADTEMGEFTLPHAHPNGGTSDHRSVVAHAQCGEDHGLELA